MYSIACSTTYLVTAISIERLNVISKPYLLKNMSPHLELSIILGCICGGLFWALLPGLFDSLRKI
jgi:hypothetical protein